MDQSLNLNWFTELTRIRKSNLFKYTFSLDFLYFWEMKETSKELQLQYEGYLKTPLLWKDDISFGLSQFEIIPKNTLQFSCFKKPEIRLGKRVEQFAFFHFQQDKTIKLLAKNIQIQDGKTTVGEIDCILTKNEKPIHVEIIYKFYLYDKTVGNSEIEHWIGPNRRDSLFKKLAKLKEKQLPLLFNTHTKPYLNSLNLSPENVLQKVYFKAQLFIPLVDFKNNFPIVNNKCIKGFYIRFQNLSKFKNCKFYIPTKVNWLQEIQTNINWLAFSKFEEKIKLFLTVKSSPLCWLKKPNGETQKFFIVWWE